MRQHRINISTPSYVWKFYWNWRISFFLKLGMVLGAMWSCNSQIFYENSLGENDQKWSKVTQKCFFWSFLSSNLTGIDANQKYMTL